MRHVFVETNWVVGFAAPEHHQIPAARDIAAAAQRGECAIHLPSLCLGEARRTIQKFQPRKEADALRMFLQRAQHVAATEVDSVLAFLDRYESDIRRQLNALDTVLGGIRELPGMHVFALNDAMLERSVELSVGELSHLQPFDQAVLAAILVRAEQLRAGGEEDIVFCELDSDLQPWDRYGAAKVALASRYEQSGVWVYRDFEFSGPEPPPHWSKPIE